MSRSSRSCSALKPNPLRSARFISRTQEQFFNSNCKFIIVEKEGQMLPNSSYNGVLGVLQREEADLNARLVYDKLGDSFHLSKLCADAE